MNPYKDSGLTKETQYIIIQAGSCEACWKCIDACSKHLIIQKPRTSDHPHPLFQDADLCSGCGKCVSTCPHGVFVKL